VPLPKPRRAIHPFPQPIARPGGRVPMHGSWLRIRAWQRRADARGDGGAAGTLPCKGSGQVQEWQGRIQQVANDPCARPL